MNMYGLRHHGRANHGQEIPGSSGTLAHSLAPGSQQPRPRPRDGIRGLAAIARTHPRRAMN